MRDLGLMGESIFSLWCGNAGLIPNGSRIDKTGWDFLVEFPFENDLSADKIHNAAIECKIQIKASDKNERSLPIKLSNLRRLITAQMPAFFVFIEFDGKDSAQRAFIVHIDEDLISKTLKRIHELEQVHEVKNHNKRTMTIHYGSEHEISPLTGQSLRRKIESTVSNGMTAYVAHKKRFLESTGFENGFAQITFITQGEENLNDLIDVSIGAKKSANIKSFRGFHTRFGIKSRSSMLESEDGKIEMPDLKPIVVGTIRFREDRLSPSVSFACRLFISPLNASLPKELWKIRVEGDFFDLKFNPYTGVAEYGFNAGAGVRLALNKLRNVVRLLFLITSSGKKILIELLFKDTPPIELAFNGLDQPFHLSKELNALDAAINIISFFEISDLIEVSLDEISRYAEFICQFAAILRSDAKLFKVEFGVEGEGFDSTKTVACIFLITTQIGSYMLGVVLVLTGNVSPLEDGRYRLLASNASIERKIFSDERRKIRREDLIQVIESVERLYEPNFEVVTMLDKSRGKNNMQN